MSTMKLRSALIALTLGVVPLAGIEPARPSASGPAVQFSPRPVDFGFVTPTQRKVVTLTVTNVGGSDLVVSHDEVPSAFGFFLSSDGCAGMTVSPGGSCEVQVTWWPGDPYVHAEDVYVIFDNASGGYQYVWLYGTSERK